MISAAISSYCPKIKWLIEALDSAKGFDEIVLYCRGGRDRFIDQMSFDERDFGAIRAEDSFDETQEILRDYIRRHPEKNIRFYTDRVERMGYEAANYAVTLTEGDWVIPFSDDDRFIKDNLFKALLRIRDGQYDDADVVFSQVTVNDNGKWGTTTDDFSVERLFEDNLVPFSSFIKRESFFRAGGYLKEDPILDWGIWLRAKMLGMKFRYFEDPIYDYRFSQSSTMNIIHERYGDMRNMRQIIIKNAKEFCEKELISETK